MLDISKSKDDEYTDEFEDDVVDLSLNKTDESNGNCYLYYSAIENIVIYLPEKH